MRRYYLVPAIPALALVIMPFLPFVDTSQLWFGLPRMLVWGGISCVLLTPAFLIAERMMAHERGEEDEQS